MSSLPPPPPPPPPPGGSNPSQGGYGGGAPAPAEIGPRVIAFLIDWVAIPFVLYLGIAIVSAILRVVSGALGTLFALLGYLAVIGYSLWQYYMEGTTGQTIGKKQQNIKLVGMDTGQPIGFAMSFVRALINGLVCGLGWIFPFFDEQKQTLGDKVAKGTVVPA